MRIRAWNLAAVGIVFSLSLGIAASNVVFDHYGIFDTHWVSRARINLNQRYAKVDYLAEHPEHNAFHLGSSKLGHFPTQHHAGMAATGSEGQPLRWYNLGFFSGVPADHLKVLQWHTGQGRALDEVLIGLDYFAFFLPPDLGEPAFRHHTQITGKGWLENMMSYMFRSSFVYLATEADFFFGDALPPYAHDIPSGRYLPVRQIKAMRADPVAYWEKETQRVQRETKAGDAGWQVATAVVRDLAALRDWLAANQIKARFYVQPFHEIERAQYGADAMQRLDEALASIGLEALRFDKVACLGEGNAHYYDAQHFRSATAMAMLDAVYARSPLDAVCQRRDAYAESSRADERLLLELVLHHPRVDGLIGARDTAAADLYSASINDKNKEQRPRVRETAHPHNVSGTADQTDKANS